MFSSIWFLIWCVNGKLKLYLDPFNFVGFLFPYHLMWSSLDWRITTIEVWRQWSMTFRWCYQMLRHISKERQSFYQKSDAYRNGSIGPYCPYRFLGYNFVENQPPWGWTYPFCFLVAFFPLSICWFFFFFFLQPFFRIGPNSSSLGNWLMSWGFFSRGEEDISRRN